MINTYHMRIIFWVALQTVPSANLVLLKLIKCLAILLGMVRCQLCIISRARLHKRHLLLCYGVSYSDDGWMDTPR